MENRWIRAWQWMLLWCLATGSILMATVWPLSAFQDHAHWGRIAWVPLTDPSAKPLELVANVLLFVPFGYAGVRALGADRRAVWRAVALAGLLSLAVETAQVFTHGRFPSTTDLVTNLTGAVVGALLARRAGAGNMGSEG